MPSQFTAVEKIAVAAIAGACITGLIGPTMSVLAAQFQFTAGPSFEGFSGEFEINSVPGQISSGIFRSPGSRDIDLTGVSFDGFLLLGKTTSGTEFSLIPSSPTVADPFQLIDLSPVDQLPDGFASFSTPTLTFTEIPDDSETSVPEPGLLIGLGVLGSVLMLKLGSNVLSIAYKSCAFI